VSTQLPGGDVTSGDGGDDAITAPLPILVSMPDFDGAQADVGDRAAARPQPEWITAPHRDAALDQRHAPPPHTPRARDPFLPARRRRGRPGWANRRVAAMAGVSALVVGAVMLSLTGRSGEQGNPAVSQDNLPSPTAQAAPATPSAGDQAKLVGLLPADFGVAGVCQAGDVVPAGTLASVECTPRPPRPDGPAVATYRLVGQKENLAGLLKDALDRTAIQICPGNIQSPGDWRRTAAPQVAAGTVFCGTRGNTAVVGWTDTDRLIFAEIRSAPASPGTPTGAALGDLYQWWSMNS